MRAAGHFSASPREKEKHAAAKARAAGPDKLMIATAPIPGGVAMAAIVSEKPSVDVAVVARIAVADGALRVARPIEFRLSGSPPCRRSLPAVTSSAVTFSPVAAVSFVDGARRATRTPRQNHDAPVEACARALGLDIAMRRQRHVYDAPLGRRHRFELDFDAFMHHAVRRTQSDASQRRAAPRAIALDVHREEDVAIAFAMHHRIRHDCQRVEHVPTFADEQSELIVALVVAIVTARRPLAYAAHVDDDLFAVARLLDAAVRKPCRQAKSMDKTGEKIPRVFERRAQILRAFLALAMETAAATGTASEPAAIRPAGAASVTARSESSAAGPAVRSAGAATAVES
jgi:hypothetical protein